MAQPGNFTPILLYSSSTSTNVPLAANLTNSTNGAELAINIADKNLFFKDSGGTVNTVPIRQSSTSSNGWLSSTDWNTFNNKAPATSGTSLLYGNGTGGFSNVTIGSGISFAGGTLSATGAGGTVTSVAALTLGTTGTDLSSTVANGSTTPVITLNVPTASATNRGALSAADWTTFNSKQPAGSYLTAVSVVSANGFAGTSSGGTTPALTLSTSITGLLKGNGTAISAATSGTDYAPATSGSSILYGNGAGGFSNVTIGTGLSFTGGTLSSTASGGTVTSVAATVPAFLSIAGSPITTSGTLAITLSGTALPVANGGTGITTTPSNGQIPIGNGTNYTAATLTAGSGISVTNASGSITVANTQNTGPAFSAYANASQTVTNNVLTKVALQAENFDTANAFDSTTNYRFTPLVAGYYQINAQIYLVGTVTTTQTVLLIYKNGSADQRLIDTNPSASLTSNSSTIISGSTLVFMNGSTDYLELYGYYFGGTSTISQNNSAITSQFSGSLVRTS